MEEVKATESKLMKKTKSELVAIILKNDNIKGEMQDKLNNLNDSLTEVESKLEIVVDEKNDYIERLDIAKKTITSLETALSSQENITNSLKEEINGNILYVNKLTKRITAWKTFAWIAVVATVLCLTKLLVC